MDLSRDAHDEARQHLLTSMRASGLVRDARVLTAFASVPRHEFVPAEQRDAAYDDRALPLSEGQTISQPTMIAVMLDLLAVQPQHRVLEVGSGCGYALALLAQLAQRVDGVEIRPALAEQSRAKLAQLGIENAFVHTGDGSAGLPQHAPFDRILVSAGARQAPPLLLEQLAAGGRIAIPIGDEIAQTLMIGERDASGALRWQPSIPCMFVPFVDATDVE